MILDAGIDPDERDTEARTPLMYAGSTDVVRLLIDRGADLNAVHEYDKDALANAMEEQCGMGVCDADRFDVARTLIDAGADLERVDGFGKSRLASAAFGHQANGMPVGPFEDVV